MANGETGAEWKAIGGGDGFAPACLKTVKADGHQLVVGRTDAGELFALDNRCPHEGYPLAQGELNGDKLTCCWHNWKFKVGDGQCVLGGEAVRAYPVRERAGEVEVDLSDPDPATLIPGLRDSLAEGIRRHDNGRALRDGIRLLQLGVTPRELITDLAVYDARHAEYGSSHVQALGVDCERLAARRSPAEAMYAIAPVIDLCGETNVRLPAHPRLEPIRGATAGALRAAVEAEDGARAEGLVRGGFADGVAAGELWGWLYGVMSDHFTDFGHQLIYLVKTEELLPTAGRPGVDRAAAAGRAEAEEIAVGLVRSVVLATREDTLPYMGAYRSRLDELAAELEPAYAAARADAPFTARELIDAVLDGSPKDALDRLWGAISDGVPAPSIARALVVAGAERVLRFDERHDADPDVAENWLWATHRFTFAAAVRVAVDRVDSPDALRLLFQAVAFINSGRAMDAPEEHRVRVDRTIEGGLEELIVAIIERDADAALGIARSHLVAGRGESLGLALTDLALAAPLARPIFLAHAIKTTVAAVDEMAILLDAHEVVAPADAELPLLAAVRFLASPIVEARLPMAVRTSLRWVVDGVMPSKLTQ